MPLPFIKMHGAGNDFVIFDARARQLSLTPKQAQVIAARHTGIGCDQIIVIEPPAGSGDAFMRIINADGSESASCGDATRCVAWLLCEESGDADIVIETAAGNRICHSLGRNVMRVDMGEPKLDWREIPLSEACDALHLRISAGELHDPVAVGMGNPHMVFVVPDVVSAPVAILGPQLEYHPLFPERANVSFAQVIDPARIALRVWERGAGETLACGTAACATLVALHQRGLAADRAIISLSGGDLDIYWEQATNHVWMTGSVTVSFRGEWNE